MKSEHRQNSFPSLNHNCKAIMKVITIIFPLSAAMILFLLTVIVQSKSKIRNGLDLDSNETIPILTRRGSDKNTVIRMASKGNSFLVINGVFRARVSPKTGIYSLYTNVRPGDVITVESYKLGRSAGLLMDIEINRKHFYTGHSRLFKTRRAFPPKNPAYRAWRTKQYSSCSWSGPSPVRDGPQYAFPKRAKYVWVDRYERRGRVLFRFVVNGEICKKKPEHGFCPCRPIRNRKSYCYDMSKENFTYGRCKRRRCRTKYICVPGAKNLPICIRRYAIYKVVRAGHKESRRNCRKIRINPPRQFWVRY